MTTQPRYQIAERDQIIFDEQEALSLTLLKKE